MRGGGGDGCDCISGGGSCGRLPLGGGGGGCHSAELFRFARLSDACLASISFSWRLCTAEQVYM